MSWGLVQQPSLPVCATRIAPTTAHAHPSDAAQPRYIGACHKDRNKHSNSPWWLETAVRRTQRSMETNEAAMLGEAMVRKKQMKQRWNRVRNRRGRLLSFWWPFPNEWLGGQFLYLPICLRCWPNIHHCDIQIIFLFVRRAFTVGYFHHLSSPVYKTNEQWQIIILSLSVVGISGNIFSPPVPVQTSSKNLSLLVHFK